MEAQLVIRAINRISKDVHFSLALDTLCDRDSDMLKTNSIVSGEISISPMRQGAH